MKVETHLTALFAVICVSWALAAEASPVALNPGFLPKIVGKSADDAAAVLGAPDAPCLRGKHGLKCVYRDGKVEIVYIAGKADWITYNRPTGVGFYPGALRELGLSCPVDLRQILTSADSFTWPSGLCSGLASVQIFAGEGRATLPGDFRDVSYIYLKARTP